MIHHPNHTCGGAARYETRQSDESCKPAHLPLARPSPSPLLPPPPHPSSKTTTFCWPPLSYSSENHIDRLPPEIILKIFSYLDADSLFSVTFVNRQFHRLANDNSIWFDLYANDAKKWRPRLALLHEYPAGQDPPPGFWRRLIFRERGCPRDTLWKKELRHMNPYTGMPAQTQQLLGTLRVTWEITLTLRRGQERVYKQSHISFSDSSLTVCWNSGLWPRIHQVSTLQLHGVFWPFTCSTDRPQWHSLIRKTHVSGQPVWRYIRTDKLVRLIDIDDGIVIGVWRGTWVIAFVMANLHFHRLVERSLLGSLSCPYSPPDASTQYDDVDLGSGLQGYTMFIVLHNSLRRIMQRRYSPLACSREDIRDGFAHFRLTSEHTPVLGRISFPWAAEGLQGDMKDCCVMTVTVLDDGQKPLWCASSTVTLMRCTESDEEFTMLCKDKKGRVRLRFVWMQDMQQFFLTSLHLYISINQQLGSDFKSY
ncbi:F-box only protein 15 isoform X2 [Hoplias malabaricus]|uniref:F-box only protein 15 isoform X2 n=1 Tax=Hoplias malabaricus TaxID=27720 RepID=UPI0034635DBF